MPEMIFTCEWPTKDNEGKHSKCGKEIKEKVGEGQGKRFADKVTAHTKVHKRRSSVNTASITKPFKGKFERRESVENGKFVASQDAVREAFEEVASKLEELELDEMELEELDLGSDGEKDTFREKMQIMKTATADQKDKLNRVKEKYGALLVLYNELAEEVYKKTGQSKGEFRLKELLASLHQNHNHNGGLKTDLALNITKIKKIMDPDITLVTHTDRNKMVIPEFPAFCQQLRDIFNRCHANQSGKVASYIPQLARYDQNMWAASVCTVDGERFSMGDVDISFTMQSVSKAFTYSICLNELGPEEVHKFIGHEPSGRNFNEICLDRENKPHNPMLNSGAIMSAGLILQEIEPKGSLSEKYDFVFSYFQMLAGYESIGFNNSVFLSERETADRNFAMAYYLKENNCFPENMNLHECLDLYFQACSLEVNTESLSVMGATLANGGICPTTGEEVLRPSNVRDVLSLMYSCGMYNYSGQFAFKVGLPAKSGVSGAILLVVPNVMSIALWSPPLDEIGNSVRAQQFCTELVDTFNFHRFDNKKHIEKKLDPRRESYEVKGLFAAVTGDLEALKGHYEEGLDMGMADYDGRTALHLSSAEGQLSVVKFLLNSCEVEAEVTDRWGHTPLMEAERGGHHEVAALIRDVITSRKSQGLS